MRFSLLQCTPCLNPQIGPRLIGKSYFVVYVLLRRLSAKRPVIFNSHYGVTYWFQESGVSEKKTASIVPRDLDPTVFRPDEQCLWSLIDPPIKKEPIEGPIIDHRLFYAISASPDITRFKHLYRAPRWLLSPWTVEELSVL